MPGEWIRRPIFIIGCNRSGNTLLFSTLAKHPTLWSNYDESEVLFRQIFPADGPNGDLVERSDDPAEARVLAHAFYQKSHNKEYVNRWPYLRWLPDKAFQRPLGYLYRRRPIRLIDKTPSNCFRVSFLAQSFVDAQFIFLTRRGEAVVSSLMEGWKRWDGGEYTGENWHYLRPPGWRRMLGRALVEVCLFQWCEANMAAWRQLKSSCPGRFLLVRYEDAVKHPVATHASICSFLDLSWDEHFASVVRSSQDHPYYIHPGSPPEEGKWKRLHGEEIQSVIDRIRRINRMFYAEDDTNGEAGCPCQPDLCDGVGGRG